MELVVATMRDLMDEAAESLLLGAGFAEQHDMACRVPDRVDQEIAGRRNVSDAEESPDPGPGERISSLSA